MRSAAALWRSYKKLVNSVIDVQSSQSVAGKPARRAARPGVRSGRNFAARASLGHQSPQAAKRCQLKASSASSSLPHADLLLCSISLVAPVQSLLDIEQSLEGAGEGGGRWRRWRALEKVLSSQVPSSQLVPAHAGRLTIQEMGALLEPSYLVDDNTISQTLYII
jgi:hypothetical protein